MLNIGLTASVEVFRRFTSFICPHEEEGSDASPAILLSSPEGDRLSRRTELPKGRNVLDTLEAVFVGSSTYDLTNPRGSELPEDSTVQLQKFQSKDHMHPSVTEALASLASNEPDIKVVLVGLFDLGKTVSAAMTWDDDCGKEALQKVAFIKLQPYLEAMPRDTLKKIQQVKEGFVAFLCALIHAAAMNPHNPQKQDLQSLIATNVLVELLANALVNGVKFVEFNKTTDIPSEGLVALRAIGFGPAYFKKDFFGHKPCSLSTFFE